jgi:hypothetical protein
VDLRDRVWSAISEINLERDKVVEDYIRFWLAVMVPEPFLTPEWYAENLVLCNEQDYSGGKVTNRYWIEFKGPSRER